VTKPSTANGGFPSVVVTAVAATTSIAPDIESTWKGLLAGESGIRVLEDEFVTKWDLPVKIGGHLKEPVDDHMGRLELRRMSYVQRMAKLLSGQLWESAGRPEVDPDRFTVVVGTGLGGAERIVESYDLMNEGGPRKVSPLAVQMIMPNGAAATVGLQLGARAGVMTPVSACSSGSEAIAHGWRQIVMGDADFAVCGGVEGGIEALPIAAFSMMRAMSTRNDDPEGASRPFDKDRDGFVVGEGAGILILEELEFAKRRGANILAEIIGYGMSADAFHMTGMAPEGEGCSRSMRHALKVAGLQPDKIDYVNAHATSTPLGDALESKALENVFGERALNHQLLVSSTKSMTGHLLGGAGGLEAVITILAMQHQVAPPTMNLENVDPQCRLNYVANKVQPAKIDYALSNSFGFGGTNGSLVFKRWGVD
jgi:beta-ketoacyl ACP synthase